jgi:hypothetical protein
MSARTRKVLVHYEYCLSGATQWKKKRESLVENERKGNQMKPNHVGQWNKIGICWVPPLKKIYMKF